ncbi:MurR/RpiR family transcriptional regulator [Streptomyces sp. NPDC046685]|uniref:MurR/RpiR family transcriptional regulator n=1 Tax=Streptomyces sp. NPDC046685 TaxID=3157202 RepID=UPI0033C5D3BF
MSRKAKETSKPADPAPRGPGGQLPPSPSALPARVRALAPSLTRSAQAVAHAVASDPAGCARLTVTALAQRTGTSEATVVRTARLLGYAGYRDLRLALAALAALATRPQSGPEPVAEAGAAPAPVAEAGAAPAPPATPAPAPAPAGTADIAVDDPLADVVAKLAHAEAQALTDTAAGLDLTQLAAAVTALATARRIDVYGFGACALVGQDLAQKLLRIGLLAHAHSDPQLAVTGAVQLGPGDVAVAFAPSGAPADDDVIEPLRTASARGATTIALTARPDSPVTRHADLVLTTPAARETRLRPAALAGRTGQLLVTDCLFVGVAQRTYERAAPALAATREALAHRHHRPHRSRTRRPDPQEPA